MGPSPSSQFEPDPAVKVMRAWSAQYARAVNGGAADMTALRRLETSTMHVRSDALVRADKGLHYPGPLPFQPVKVLVRSGTERMVGACEVTSGFAVGATTGPAGRQEVRPVDIDVVLQGGSWVINRMGPATDVACDGVTVGMPTW